MECLLKNGISSDITRKSDILAVLTSIYKDIQIEKEGMGAAMRTAEEIAIAATNYELAFVESPCDLATAG